MTKLNVCLSLVKIEREMTVVSKSFIVGLTVFYIILKIYYVMLKLNCLTPRLKEPDYYYYSFVYMCINPSSEFIANMILIRFFLLRDRN